MPSGHVFISLVDVLDDEALPNPVFTREKVKKWRDHTLNAYEYVMSGLKKQIDSGYPVKFFCSRDLVDEVICDAIIGLRKITDIRGAHPVEDPNPFKVAAYLSYWWLRHKPVSVHYPKGYPLVETQMNVSSEEEDVAKREQRTLVWRLKHINELVAVQMATTYIFSFEKVLCHTKECKRIKKRSEQQDVDFCFQNFDDMKTDLLQKLTYHFAYRAIAPKVIEHVLEGYTFHPAWCWTGALWSRQTGDG